MNYALYNEATKKRLTLPKTGVWYTLDLAEAIEMRNSIYNYMKLINIPANGILVIDAETGIAIEESF
jgi:hypothetical protein